MTFWILRVCVLVLILTKIRTADLMLKSADNYGPYDVSWSRFEVCRGPKQLSYFNGTTELLKQANGTYRGIAHINVLEDSHIDEIRLSVYNVKDNKKTLMWNYIVNKPCQHYMLAALLEKYAKGKTCVIKKAYYYMDLQLTDLMRNYMGNSFFYGDYIIKAVGSSKKANFICFMFDPKFKKQAKN